MIRGKHVTLRPVAQADVALLDAWGSDEQAQGEYNTFGMIPSAAHERSFNENGMLGEAQGVLMVVNAASEPIGSVTYHHAIYGPNSGSRAYNMGISIPLSSAARVTASRHNNCWQRICLRPTR